MLGVKGVVLESARKFLNKKNKKNHLGNSGCQIQMTVILPISKLFPSIKFSLFPWNRLLTRLKKQKLLILKKFHITFRFQYDKEWFDFCFVGLCILYCSLDHWEAQNSSHHCCYEGKKKRGIKQKSCILRKNKYGCIWTSYAASLSLNCWT